MERKVGKYTIEMTAEEITVDNFFKHSIDVKAEGTGFVHFPKEDVCLFMSQTLRYSENEKEIREVIKEYICVLKNRIGYMEELL